MSNTIFVVEDNIDLQELFLMLLQEEGFEVTIFENAASFVHAIERFLPDLFLLDVMLPDGNGKDICCALKEDQKTSRIPVIMTSANSNLQQIMIDCSADDYIAKPFDINELIDKVNHQLNRFKGLPV